MIKKCEVSSSSSYVPLYVQDKIPHNFHLGTGASHNSMPKVDMDKLRLDITKPAQLASTQPEKAVCQTIEEEGPQIWDTFFDGACSKKATGAGEVFVSPTQEYIDSPFILIVQATDDTSKYAITLIIQQVYKSFHERHPRMRSYREGVKYKPSLLDKVKCPKIFEVDDQINKILQVFDELADMHIDQEKETFHRKVKRVNSQYGDYFLQWDALKERQGDPGKFDALWT